MTPPEKYNIWFLLLKQIFGGLFNILLWICVACELVLALFMNGDDIVTPFVLSGVIIASGVLQWWTEMQAASMMDALQKMQVAENVTVFRRKPGEGCCIFLRHIFDAKMIAKLKGTQKEEGKEITSQSG